MMRCSTLAATAVLLVAPGVAAAQSTAGSGTTVVFPVTAQTSSFASQVTLFNPGPNLLTASVAFYEANDSSAPGPKTCNDVSVSANRSVQFQLGTQCALGSGSHFGLLVVADKALPPVNYFYGYTRVQNPQGIGFSVEGFPAQNFNNQVSNATGLKKQAASPTYQTNCFVGSLDQAVSYQLRLFNDATGTQIGGTLSGSLAPFQQYRYLDVFGVNGVNAPAGDQTNVRAQFTQTSGGGANLIGFCTVQDNTSFGADFRIAKSYGSPSSSFFAQGGNAFGTVAELGTLDNWPLDIFVNNALSWQIRPDSAGISPVVIGGYGSPLNGNSVINGASGATISGGGAPGTTLFINGCNRPCRNRITDAFGTIGGGAANLAGDDAGTATDEPFATVGGGFQNTSSAGYATVGGGEQNTASGSAATVAGGNSNTASGTEATVAGGAGNIASGDEATVAGGVQNTASGFYSAVVGGFINTAAGDNSFAAGSQATIPVTAPGTFFWNDHTGPQSLPSGAHDEFIVIATNGIGFYTSKDFSHGCALVGAAGSWSCTSDLATKSNFAVIEPREVLARLVKMPIAQWRWKGEPQTVRHIGPTAQDFRAAFGLGHDDKTITLVDSEGVALAAIQGLNQVMQEKDAQIQAQQRQIENLRSELDAVKRAVAELTQNGGPWAVRAAP